jgi:hypothetical protein
MEIDLDKMAFETAWNEKYQVQLVNLALLWGKMMLVKGLDFTLANLGNKV